MSALAFISEPMSYSFMRNAALGTLAVGIAAPVAGVWATNRRLVYLTDAMSHAVLAGVAGAALLGGSLLVGGLLAALAMALGVAALVVRTGLAEDSAIGVVGQGLFALGVIGVSVNSDPRALSHILFGNALTVTRTDVIAQLLLAAAVLVTVTLALPTLIATTFDPLHARSIGVRTALVDTAVIVGLGLVVVVGLTTVGVLMALTLCVAPAVAARALSSRLTHVLVIAAALGLVIGQAGLLLSYHLGLPTGPVVAALAVATAILTTSGRALNDRTSGRCSRPRNTRPPSPQPQSTCAAYIAPTPAPTEEFA
ncbi:MAG: metal ABC transporter permease [Sporichthyaceae bacterium]